MSLSDLRNSLPDYAKDLKLNLDSVLSEPGAQGLDGKQIRAIALASAIASRLPATSIAQGAAAMIAARIFAGSSLRGLSSVTMTTSDRRVATAPISGRLPWSRSPPAPNTVMSRRAAIGRAVSRRFRSASSVWA